jgi:2-polyprenyl-3-methyl-5-hydroxy-6-metoxy-1,4-benzoquinol methylase
MSAYEFKSSPYSSHSLLLARLPQEGRGQTVLDLGCGNGYLSAILAHRGYNVTAVERPGGYTNEFPLLVNLIQTDLDSGLPPMATKFRYVICADILEHLKRPVEMLMAIKLTAR